MLTEDEIVDRIEILADHSVCVRRATRVLRHGVPIAAQLHRHVLRPGDDLSAEDRRVADVARAAWRGLPGVQHG